MMARGKIARERSERDHVASPRDSVSKEKRHGGEDRSIEYLYRANDLLLNVPRAALKALALYPKPPKTRGDCEEGPRPCPWVTCRYSLYHEYGTRFDRSERDAGISDDAPSCALDVANDGPHTLEQVAAALGMTRQRIEQIERSAIARLSKLNRRLLLGTGESD